MTMRFLVLAMAGLVLWSGALRANDPGRPLVVRPQDCIVVVPQKTTALIDYAVAELRDHVKRVSGVELPLATDAAPGKFTIHVGLRPADDDRALASEEARWRITDRGVWLYGSDRLQGKAGAKGTPLDIALNRSNQTGTLFAVYEFLENSLGVKWIEPGEAGITYKPLDVFTLAIGQGGWTPQLVQRHMRTAYKEDLRERALKEANIPDDLRFSEAEFSRRQQEELIWRRRMRMGGDLNFTYGHAFTKWWAQYGRTHPEYFALGKNGKRGPASAKNADRVKMCVSNPDLIKQIVKDHFESKGGLVINACENDSRGFCRCPDCMALDVRLPGEERLDVDDLVLTDRYVHFANAVLREAKKYNPEAKTVFYAYSRYNFPPRRERLDDGVILFLLPNLSMTEAETKAYYQAWKDANAKDVFLRPNDLCQDTGLPHGFEQHMFMKLKTAQDYLVLRGTDYDTCWGFWPITGVANYIMARSFYHPERSFETWNQEYCQTYGDASPEIAAYYAHWRTVWNDRVMPNLDRIGTMTEGLKLLRNKLSQLSDVLYSENDFDATDALLAKAAERKLLPSERQRVQTLILANRHSRLKYEAMRANRLGSAVSEEARRRTAQVLYDFRREHRSELNIHWELMLYLENAYSDNAGLERLLGTETPAMRDERLRLENEIATTRTPHEKPLY